MALALGAGAPAAQGAASDPLFVFIPSPPVPQGPLPVTPPPTGYLNGPCGVVVDSNGRFLVSDYYHHAVDVFSAGFNTDKSVWETGYSGQLANEDPNGGPCGLALDSTNKLYVNNYHRNVTKFNAFPSFGVGTVFPLPSEDADHHLPTGVAVDPATGNVYVNNRTYISVYDSAGNPVLDAGNPLKIGVGTLGDAYGLAFSTFPATYGSIYVPDAASNTVKVYEPATNKVTPVAEIKDPFGQPFSSLKDSAIAIDRVTGDVYLADNTQPKYTERPQATIHIYSSTGSYKGHLKYNVYDALPVGIAVDNSTHIEVRLNKEEIPTQGRVYITSGNTNQAGVYAYPPGAATTGTPLPPTTSLVVSTSGSGSVTSAVAKLDCESTCERDLLSGGELTLTATPDPGSTFAGWSGETCSGADPSCTLTMDEATSVSAEFVTQPSSPQAPLAASSAPGTEAQTATSRAVQRKKPCRRAKKHCRQKAKRHRHRSAQRR